MRRTSWSRTWTVLDLSKLISTSPCPLLHTPRSPLSAPRSPLFLLFRKERVCIWMRLPSRPLHPCPWQTKWSQKRKDSQLKWIYLTKSHISRITWPIWRDVWYCRERDVKVRIMYYIGRLIAPSFFSSFPHTSSILSPSFFLTPRRLSPFLSLPAPCPQTKCEANSVLKFLISYMVEISWSYSCSDLSSKSKF